MKEPGRGTRHLASYLSCRQETFRSRVCSSLSLALDAPNSYLSLSV